MNEVRTKTEWPPQDILSQSTGDKSAIGAPLTLQGASVCGHAKPNQIDKVALSGTPFPARVGGSNDFNKTLTVSLTGLS